MGTLRTALAYGTTTRLVPVLAMLAVVDCGGRIILGRGEDSLAGGRDAGGAGALSMAGAASGGGGAGSAPALPADAGRAGASPADSVLELAQTVQLGLHGSMEVPSVAFSGNHLGIVAVAGAFGQRSIVFARDLGTSFEQQELDRAPRVDVPALAGDQDGFQAAWWSTSADGYGAGTVHLARLSPEGSLVSRLIVAEQVPGKHCDVATGAGLSAVACGTDQFALCTQDACEPVTLPTCQEAGDAKVVWDGDAFATVRTCRTDDGISSTLRFSRISPSRAFVVDETDVVTAAAAGVRPGLLADDDRLLVVFAGRLYTLDFQGHVVGDPVQLSSLDSDADAGFLVDFESDGEIVRPGNGLLAFHAWHPAPTTEAPAGDSVVIVLDSSLNVLGEAPSLLDGNVWGTGVAASTSGRSVVAALAPSTVAIAELDTATFTPSDARFLDGVPDYPAVSDVYCDASSCRVALTTEAVEGVFGAFPSSIVEVDVDLASATMKDEGRSFGDCGDQPCRVWFTADGATVLAGPDEVRWVAEDGTPVWDEPLGVAEVDSWQGPIGRTSPSLMLRDPSRYRLVALSDQGPNVAPLDSTDSPIVGCGDDWYLVRSRADGQELQLVDARGLGGSFPAIPYDSAKEQAERYVCGGDQAGLVELDSNGDRFFRRVSRTGDTLPAVPLVGQVLSDASGPDSVYLLLEPSEASGGSSPRTTYVLMRIPTNESTEELAMTLPKPGWVDGIMVSGNAVHVSWHTGRALWLSSYRRQ